MSIEDKQTEAYQKKEVLKQIHHIDVGDLDNLFKQFENEYQSNSINVYSTLNKIEEAILSICTQNNINPEDLYIYFDDLEDY